MLHPKKRLQWLIIVLGMVVIGGTLVLVGHSLNTASAMPNPPTVLTARPTGETAPRPTRVAKGGNTIVLENTAAPVLPTLTAPIAATKGGVTVRLEALDGRALDKGRVDALVCFSLPSPSLDWSVGEAWLEVTGGKWPVASSALLRYRKGPDGTMWRCEVVTFRRPKAGVSGAQFTLRRVVIASLHGPRGEQPDCAAIQKALESEGIQVAPVQQAGVGGCRVVGKPAAMSLEEAQARVAELLLPQRRGPWLLRLPER